MTKNKSLKRHVRARMTKTGERYTAARRHVVAHAPDVSPAAPPPADPEPLHGPTGRPLSAWFALLDNWAAREKPHADIARWLNRDQGVDGWWSQDITVRYEKHIGRRVLGQRGSTFSATATKTIAVASDIARAAWTDPHVRSRWLADVRLDQRPNRAATVARFDVNAGEGRLVVSFDAKGPRTTVAIEHEKLTDADAAARWTNLWRERLVALKELLEMSSGR